MKAVIIIDQLKNLIITILKLFYWYAEALYKQLIPPPMVSIDGEIILVTGAAGGIGREICKNLVKSGRNIKLVLWDLDSQGLEKLIGELEIIGDGLGHKIYPFVVDISKRENIDECCMKVKDEVGYISIIFNNAGIAPVGNILSFSTDQITKTIDINLLSQLWIIRQFLPDMVLNNHGRIINICSIAGLKAGPLSSSYVASKFAVTGFTDTLKMELELFNCDGIHVTTVYPYFVKTNIINSLKLDENSGNLKLLPGPLRKFLEPEEVGRKCVEGMRREYEHVYMPSILPITVFIIDYILPNKARKLYHAMSTSNFAYADAAEHRRVFASYKDTIQNEEQSMKRTNA